MSFKTDEWQKSSAEDDVIRSQPFALGFEKSVLSTLLQYPAEFIPLAIEEQLTERHFYLPNHAVLFGFLLELFAAGKEVELVSLIQRLLDRGLLDKVGGPSAISDIYTHAPSSGNFRTHVAGLRNKFAAREILRISNESIAAVYDGPDEIPETLETMEKEIMAIRDIEGAEKPQTVRQAAGIVIDKFHATLRHEPSAKGISTGFEEFDRMTNGLCAPDMIVIGARPSVGKTAYLLNVADHVCITEGKPTLLFSAEMSTEQITRRMIFTRAKFALSDLSRGYTPNKGDLMRIQRATMEVAGAPLHIDDKAGPTISYIRAKARRMKREHDIQFIGIDYLGLIKSMTKQSAGSREREIAEISAGVKGLCKELGIPILILAQLNREVEKRSSGKTVAKPKMSDLKDSGAIEADADIIGLLSRADYQGGDEEAPPGLSCLDLVKNRNGATGPLPLTFVADLMRFETGMPAKYPESSESTYRFGN